MTEPDLRALIRDIPDFPSAGILFKDITPLLLDHEAVRSAVRQLAEWSRPREVDFVVAAEARGFILGAALALELDAGFVPARKPGKLPSETVSAEYILEYGVDALEMHADALADGARVLIHDDLLATGGTARALAELVESLGGTHRRLRVPGRAGVPRGPAAARRLRRPRADLLRGLVGRPPLAHGGRAGRRCLADRARPLPPAALVAEDAARRGRQLGRLDVGAGDREGSRDPRRLPRRAVEGLGAAASGRRSWRGRRSSGCSARSCSRSTWRPPTPGTAVGIETRQKPKGWARFGGVMLRRAAKRQADEALAGLAGLVEEGA